MNKLLAVIRREFIERVRTRAFILGTILVPASMVGFGAITSALANRETGTRGIVVLEQGEGRLGERVEAALRQERIGEGPDAPPRYEVRRLSVGDRMDQVRDSIVSLIGVEDAPADAPTGVLILSRDAAAQGRATYLGSNVTSFRDMRRLERLLDPVLREDRLRNLNADSAVIAAAGVRFDLSTSKVSKGQITGQSGEASFWVAYVTALVMYISLLMYGMQVMMAVLEEKTNRIVEVLISSLTPFQLMLGKVLGVGAAGLLQLGIWGGAAFYASSALSRPSLDAATADPGAVDATAAAAGSPGAVSPELIVIVLVFFLLGFFLYSSLYAAVGAMCSTQQEAQQANTPVTILLALGMVAMFGLLNDPSGSMARALTLIPLFAPLVVPVRYAITPVGTVEVLLSIGVTILGILAISWVAGRIYRVGILSYGKRPTPRELWRWVRNS